MVRNCNNCGFVNQDDYDYCAKCGTPLVEGLRPKQVYVLNAQEPQINKKMLIISLNLKYHIFAHIKQKLSKIIIK